MRMKDVSGPQRCASAADYRGVRHGHLRVVDPETGAAALQARRRRDSEHRTGVRAAISERELNGDYRYREAPTG